MYFYLKEPKSKDNTLIIIQYYIKGEKKNFKYSTGQKINPKDWSFENRLPKLSRGGKGQLIKHVTNVLLNYNNYLELLIRESEINNTLLTRQILKNKFDIKFRNVQQNELSNVIYKGIDLFIEKKKKSKGVSRGWTNKYKNLRNKIILFDKYKSKEHIFNDITSDWLDEYVGFLRNLPTLLEDKNYYNKVSKLKIKLPKTPYNDNTLNRHIIFLFTFLNWSKDKLHKLNLDNLKNPTRAFQSDDVYLTSDEIKLIENVVLERASLQRVRDLFLIGVYSGQRFSDYSVFEKEDMQGNMIIKRSEKTEKESFIPLHKSLKDLLDKYDWKLPKISSQKFNPHIREVCRIAGITERIKKTNYIGNKKEVKYYEKCDMVSSHTARRTFITLSSEKNMPDHIIMKITGIRDPKTLIKYKKTSQKVVFDFMDELWK